MPQNLAKTVRVRRLLWILLSCLLLFVAGGVWVSHQFPALTNGPKSSVELLNGLFHAPIEISADAARYALNRVKKDAIVGFVQLVDAPSDVKGRITRFVQGERYDDVTAPFLYYLYDLYAAPALADPDLTADLAYGESIDSVEPGAANPGLQLLQHPAAVRRHAGNALRIFDALFLQTKPGANLAGPLPDRYEPAAYDDIKSVIRELAAEFLGPPSDAKDEAKSEYVVMFEETLRDDDKLSEFIEFFSDLVRQLADSWLDSFVRREERKKARLDWFQRMERQNRYFEIADYARSQCERKLAIHMAVDGLQGKLLEGLVQLSDGDRSSPSARYVIELVQRHQMPDMDPATYGSVLPPPLGNTIVELAERSPRSPGYLANFKKYFFAADAPAVVVHVATVDTPSISVRNLPIIYTGHGVAGPHGTGIPNFSYLNREDGRGWYFWGSDVLHMRDIFANREDLIPRGRRRDGPGAKTIMDRLWQRNTVCAMATIDNGALEKISSEVGIGIGELQRNFIEKVLIQKFRARAEMERKLNERRRWLIDHRNTSDSLLASLITRPVTLKTFRDHAQFIAEHEDEGLPDYLLWYNPWPDHFAHGKGPYSDFILGYEGEYDRLDFYLGKMMDVYESVPVVGGSGSTYADRALVGVVSDHGLVYTPKLVSTDTLLFEAMRQDGIDVRTMKLTHDEGGLPAIHGRERIRPTRPFDAVVGSTAGGSYIIDLFGTVAETGEDELWKRHPGYHELRSLKLGSGQTIDFIDALKSYLNGTMDFALVREYGPEPGVNEWPEVTLPGQGSGWVIESVVRIIAPDRGEARIYRIQWRGAGDPSPTARTLYRYEILGDEDPLDLAGSVRDYLIADGREGAAQVGEALQMAVESTEGRDDATWQVLLSHTVRPDVIYQLSHLYDSERAGTVNVFPVEIVGMNSGVPGRHAGEAFGEKNGTQLYRCSNLVRRTIQTARNGSVPVTLFHWLIGNGDFGRVAEQFGYPSLLRDSAFGFDSD